MAACGARLAVGPQALQQQQGVSLRASSTLSHAAAVAALLLSNARAPMSGALIKGTS
jgi:hypothetical protein